MKINDNNKTLVVVIIGIILVLVVVLGLLFAGVIKIDMGKDEVVSNKNIKIDDSKYYVYDAEYETNTNYKEYGKAFGNEFDTQVTNDGFNTRIVSNGILRISDLRIPYININTQEVLKINHDLKELYDKYVKYYIDNATRYNNAVQKYGVDFNSNPGLYGYPMLNYYTYNFNNVLSVVVTYGYLGTDSLHPEYLVYNFDLNSGKLLTYNQLLDKFGINAAKAKSLIVKMVTEYVNSSESVISDFLSETEEELKNSINDGTALCFVDAEGRLNYIVKIHMNAGIGFYPQKIMIEK